MGSSPILNIIKLLLFLLNKHQMPLFLFYFTEMWESTVKNGVSRNQWRSTAKTSPPLFLEAPPAKKFAQVNAGAIGGNYRRGVHSRFISPRDHPLELSSTSSSSLISLSKQRASHLVDNLTHWLPAWYPSQAFGRHSLQRLNFLRGL